MTYEIFNEDCLTGLKRIPNGSVDMILDDLPFGTTALSVDKPLPLETMWEEFLRVTKYNAAIVLFSQMPFGAELIQSAKDIYRHEWIYEKTLPTGHLNANKMPLRIHENILIFYRALPKYNPQFTQGKPYQRNHKIGSLNYSTQTKTALVSDGRRYPVDVIKARQPICEGEQLCHPQQKPVPLLEYLIKTYTDAGETVLDATMGSGSTGVAAVNTGRKFIGFELDREYFTIARGRISEAEHQREELLARLKSIDMKIVEKPTSELLPYENNPRINDAAVEPVAKSISEFGFKVPIVIDSSGGIICGHTRFKAAQLLGLETVTCVIADDLTDDQIKAFRIVDNKTSEIATWKVDDLNAELAALSEFDMKSFGFDISAIEGVDISPDKFSEEFSLPSETNSERQEFQIQAIFHKKQAKLIRQAMNSIGEPKETFGNTNQAGNMIYEIVRQWTEMRK